MFFFHRLVSPANMKTRKGRRRPITTAYSLPDELTQLILSKLPVKTLIRFLSICKSWHSLISHPSFINLHLLEPSRAEHCRNMPMPDPLELTTCFIHDKPPPIPGLQWTKCTPNDVNMLGCWNGILCVHVTRRWWPSRLPINSVYLWNPALKIVKHYPRADIFHDKKIYCRVGCLGFVFDDGPSNDYKLLRVQWFGTRVEAEVYSFGTYSWKKIKDSPPTDFDHQGQWPRPSFAIGVYVSEALHWVGRSGGVIHSFNMRDEVFREFVMPDGFLLGRNTSHVTDVFTYKGLLAVLSLRGLTGCGSGVLWIMKEYGVTSSWTKLNIDAVTYPRRTDPLEPIIDHDYGNSGNVVVSCSYDDGYDHSCDHSNYEISSLTLERWSYRESLVFLDKRE